jgi:hypothetical protein
VLEATFASHRSEETVAIYETFSRVPKDNICGRIMTGQNHISVTFTGKSVIVESLNLVAQIEVDGERTTCSFTWEALQDINPVTSRSDMQELFDANQTTLLLVIHDMLDNGHKPPLMVTTERVNEWRNRSAQR